MRRFFWAPKIHWWVISKISESEPLTLDKRHFRTMARSLKSHIIVYNWPIQWQLCMWQNATNKIVHVQSHTIQGLPFMLFVVCWFLEKFFQCQTVWIMIRPNILDPNCLQRLSADDTSRKRVKGGEVFGKVKWFKHPELFFWFLQESIKLFWDNHSDIGNISFNCLC